MKNQIIKFPFPSWDKITDFDSSLISKPYCICYRYDFSDLRKGSFGFKNEKAHLFLNELLKKMILVKDSDFELMKSTIPHESGFYLYDDGTLFGSISERLVFYSIKKKKNEFLLKRGMGVENIEAPLILGVHSYNKYDIEVINHAIKNKYPFLFRCFYTPQAEESLVFFDEDVIFKIRELSSVMDIDYVEVSSIDCIPYP